MIRRIILSLVAVTMLSGAIGQNNTTPPRIVVNIVVGAMRSGDIERYMENFNSDGIVYLMNRGVNYKNANYSFHQTITPTTLSTLSTGALPSSHGIVGESWWEYVTGRKVDLVADKGVHDLNYNLRNWGCSATQLIAPTLTETLLEANPESKCVSIAIEPTSAIVMNGVGGSPFWVDSLTCEWGSSSAFMESLPLWVSTYNKSPDMGIILRQRWESLLPQSFYVNKRSTILTARNATRKYEAPKLAKAKTQSEQRKITYEQLAYTPAGNSVIFDFAKRIIDKLNLGGDSHPDILNIYLDPARNIAQRYGATSVEMEDMYVCLDFEISNFLSYLTHRVRLGEIVITLTSDHGISSTYGEKMEAKGLFNTQQFMVLVAGFLRAQYGSGDWVLGYENRNLYLNHRLVMEQGLNLAELQDEVASFALQFRGVAQVVTASAMRNGYFGSGYGHKIQNSFYPSRSGDVILNFMPGWIEEHSNRRADSGTTYRYDSHVPLIILAEGCVEGGDVSREVSMVNLAPTLSAILQIEAPAAADGKVLEEFTK